MLLQEGNNVLSAQPRIYWQQMSASSKALSKRFTKICLSEMSFIFIQNVSHFLSKAYVDLVQQTALSIDVNSI